MRVTGLRPFFGAFVIGVLVLAGPLALLAVRLAALGEIEAGFGADRTAAVRGTLFADAVIQEKLRDATIAAPEIVVLGSSRVGAFRSEMFAGCGGRATCFYNATSAMPTLRTGHAFLRELARVHAPKVLLLGIDVWTLDPLFVSAARDEPVRWGPGVQLEHALAVARSTASLALVDTRVRDAVLGRTAAPPDVSGLGAILSGVGYRRDGSLLFPDDEWRAALAAGDAERSAPQIAQLRDGSVVYLPFARADAGALADVSAIVDLAAASGTTVIAFTPPFSDPLAEAMREQPGYADGLRDAYRALAETLAAKGVPLVEGLSLSDYGCGPDEHLDGIHLGEVCAARVLVRVARSAGGTELDRYVDVGGLERRIAARTSSYGLPPP